MVLYDDLEADTFQEGDDDGKQALVALLLAKSTSDIDPTQAFPWLCNDFSLPEGERRELGKALSAMHRDHWTLWQHRRVFNECQ